MCGQPRLLREYAPCAALRDLSLDRARLFRELAPNKGFLLQSEDPASERNDEPDVAVISLGREHPFASTSQVAMAEPLIVEFESASPISHRFVHVIDVRSGKKVITVIEFSAPGKPDLRRRSHRLRKARREMEGSSNDAWIRVPGRRTDPPHRRGPGSVTSYL